MTRPAIRVAPPVTVLKATPPDPSGRRVLLAPIVGPPGGTGPVGPVGPAGPAGSALRYTQATPAASWTFTHNLNRRPATVLVVDDYPGVLVYTDVTYPDLNTVAFTFPTPTSGTVDVI